MSETKNLKLFKHDNPSTNTNKFDVDKALNQNWDKIDNFVGEVNTKVSQLETDVEKSKTDITGIQGDISTIQEEQNTQNEKIEELQVENERLKEDLKQATITASNTGENITINDGNGSRFEKLTLKGNTWQETSEQGKNFFSGWIKDVHLSTTTGKEVNGVNAATSNFIPVDFEKNPNYYLSGLSNELSSWVGAYNIKKEFLGRNAGSKRTVLAVTSDIFTSGTPQGTGNIAYIRITQYWGEDYADTGNGIIDELQTQLEIGNELSSYEPFTPDMPSIEFESPIRNCGEDVNYFDGEIELGSFNNNNGANTADSNCIRSKNFIEVQPDETYTLSNTLNYTEFIHIMDESHNIIKTYSDSTVQTFMTPNNAKYIRFRTSSSLKENNLNVKFKLQKGTKATGYSPCNCGGVNFKITNASLLTGEELYENMKSYNSTVTKEEKDSMECIRFVNTRYLPSKGFDVFGGNFKYKENTQYTVRGRFLKDKETTGRLLIQIIYTDGSNSSQELDTSTWEELRIVSEVNKTISKIGFTYGQSAYWYLDINSFFVGEGDVKEVEHQEQVFTFPTKEGQVFHKGDYITDDGTHHVKKTVVFDGSIDEGWSYNSSNNYVTIQIKSTYNMKVGNGTKIISNKFQEKDKGIEGINWISSNSLYVTINGLTSLDEYKAMFQKWAEEGNPFTIEGYCVNEELEPFSEEQQKAWDNIKNTAHTYKGTTHIFCTDEISCEFEEEHSIDLESYINSKLGIKANEPQIQEQPSMEEVQTDDTEMIGGGE